MNQLDETKFLIQPAAPQAAPKPLTPGQEMMRSQRADRYRPLLLQHARGKPIRVRRLPPEQHKALRKAYKKIRRGADPATVMAAAGFTPRQTKANDGHQDKTL
jgi:hypothetical protein